MILSSSFYKLKSKIKEVLGPAIAKCLSIPVDLLPTHAMKYIPFQPWRSVRLVPLSPDPNLLSCKSGLPIPPVNLRYGYGNTPDEYIELGERDVKGMLSILSTTGFQLDTGCKVLDLGCATGRMIRHFKLYSETCEIWGADIDANAVFWAKRHLGKYFHFATTTTLPHLPFEDGYFDLIYCGSVFTHIDDLADSWFLELRRVLSENGRIYATIHDENTLKNLRGSFKDHKFALWVKEFVPEVFDDEGRWGIVISGKGPGCQVFHNLSYLKNNLSPIFDILSVAPDAFGYQTAIVLAKKNNCTKR